MAETSPGGISDYAVLSQTRGEENQSTPGEKGFATLGAALSGGAAAEGQQAFNQGARMGAQTIDALAQAKQRVTAASQAHIAAQTLRDPSVQQAMGLPSEVAEYLATNAEAGVDPEKIAKAGQSFQDIKQRSTLADPNAPMQDRLGAALARAPGEAIPKAVGTAGSYQAPLAVNDQNPSPVTISPQQSRENEAEIAQRNAAAAASPINAAAHMASATKPTAGSAAAENLPPGWAKPPQNMRYAADPTAPPGSKQSDANFYARDATGRPTLEPIPGGGKDPNAPAAATGREAVQYMRVIGSARQAATDMHNLSILPIGTKMGFGMGEAPGKSLLQSTVDNYRNEIGTSSQHKLNTAFLGLSRGLAGVETSGMVPNGTFTHSFENYAPRDGDTVGDIAWKGASMRQVIENGAEVLKSNPRVSPQMNAEMDKIVGQVQKDYPYTPQDALDFDKAPKGTSLSKFLSSRQQGGETAPAGGGHPQDIQDILTKYGVKPNG